MENESTGYKILKSNNSDTLTGMVNAYLEAGWELHGSLIAVVSRVDRLAEYVHNNHIVFHQAVVRRSPSSDNSSQSPPQRPTPNLPDEIPRS